jgi:hypothetical protein
MEDCTQLLRLYNESTDKYSCQPFVLTHLPDKKVNLQTFLSRLAGESKLEDFTYQNQIVFDDFLDDNGKLTKKIEIIETNLLHTNSGLMLASQETEKSVFFRGHNYLFLETKFILAKIEQVEDIYYLYVFSKENSINHLVEFLDEKLQDMGMSIGYLSLSKHALSQMREDLGGNLTEFSLTNVTTRLKKVQGKGIDLQNDDTFNSMKEKPNAEVYRYLFRIDQPHSALNLEKLTVSIRQNCFVHSYHHITYEALLTFVKTNVIPLATATVPVSHPLSAYDKLDIYEGHIGELEEEE